MSLPDTGRWVDCIILACAEITKAQELGDIRAEFQHTNGLRNLLNGIEPLELYMSVELKLHDMEHMLNEADRDFMRQYGYNFPEDLEKIR